VTAHTFLCEKSGMVDKWEGRFAYTMIGYLRPENRADSTIRGISNFENGPAPRFMSLGESHSGKILSAIAGITRGKIS
jgi:hypothetical protein